MKTNTVIIILVTFALIIVGCGNVTYNSHFTSNDRSFQIDVDQDRDRFSYPAWSPDGKSIGFINSDGLYLYRVETNEIVKMLDNEANTTLKGLSWSPDNHYIAFRGGPSKEKNGLYILDLNSFSLSHVLNSPINELSWSPKDKNLFAVTTIGGPGRNEIFIYDLSD